MFDTFTEILRDKGMDDISDRRTARIPILKFHESITELHLECDVCLYNPLAQRNSLLLRIYAQISPRLRQCAYILKHWAKRRGINDASNGTLCSYGYILMLVHYLQRTEPPVLPVLQQIHPHWNGQPGEIYANTSALPEMKGLSCSRTSVVLTTVFRCIDHSLPLY